MVLWDVHAEVLYSGCKTTRLLKERFYSCLCVLEAEMYAGISTNASAYLRLQWKFQRMVLSANRHYFEGRCHTFEMWKACVVCWVDVRSSARNSSLTILRTSFLLVGAYHLEQPLCLLAGQCLLSAVLSVLTLRLDFSNPALVWCVQRTGCRGPQVGVDCLRVRSCPWILLFFSHITLLLLCSHECDKNVSCLRAEIIQFWWKWHCAIFCAYCAGLRNGLTIKRCPKP